MQFIFNPFIKKILPILIIFTSNSHEKIEVEISRDKSFICYPYEKSTIDEIELNKIQEFLDKGLLVKVVG